MVSTFSFAQYSVFADIYLHSDRVIKIDTLAILAFVVAIGAALPVVSNFVPVGNEWDIKKACLVRRSPRPARL